MPRLLWWSKGELQFLMSDVPLHNAMVAHLLPGLPQLGKVPRSPPRTLQWAYASAVVLGRGDGFL